jgi:hypothetical protein
MKRCDEIINQVVRVNSNCSVPKVLKMINKRLIILAMILSDYASISMNSENFHSTLNLIHISYLNEEAIKNKCRIYQRQLKNDNKTLKIL